MAKQIGRRQARHGFGTVALVLAVLAGCAGAVGPGDGSAGSDGSAGTDSAAPGCAISPGNVCPRGASCPAGDGCNTCSCSATGELACTLLACVADAGAPSCTSNADCGGGRECAFQPGCDAAGRCLPAIACDDPIAYCGCNGQTYYSCQATQRFVHVGPCEGVDAGFDGGPMVFRYPGARITVQAPGGFAGTGPALTLTGDGILRVWFNTFTFADPTNPTPREDRSRALTAAQVNEAFDRLAAVDLTALPHTRTGGGECAVEFFAQPCAGCAARRFEYTVPSQVLPEMDSVWTWFESVLRADEAPPRSYCGREGQRDEHSGVNYGFCSTLMFFSAGRAIATMDNSCAGVSAVVVRALCFRLGWTYGGPNFAAR